MTVDRTLALTSVSRRTFSPNGDGVHDAVTLSFRLTRAADVTATVVHSGSTVRTIRLGRLASGARSVVWDGKLGDGGTAVSGAYSLRVTADGALGVTTVAQPLTVDLAAAAGDGARDGVGHVSGRPPSWRTRCGTPSARR